MSPPQVGAPATPAFYDRMLTVQGLLHMLHSLGGSLAVNSAPGGGVGAVGICHWERQKPTQSAWASGLALPLANAYSGGAAMMAQLLGSSPFLWETQMQFLSLTQPSPSCCRYEE